ncbi:hypothetical protein FOI42_RS03575 [Escherichia coli]|nr:hypothetical protein [Escherichia coli]MED6699390.1 hypothetical protein [Escherichia coli O157]
MDYRVLNRTYKALYKTYIESKVHNPIIYKNPVYIIWNEYFTMIQNYFYSNEIFIDGEMRKLTRVDSIGGEIVLFYTDSIIGQQSINLEIL